MADQIRGWLDGLPTRLAPLRHLVLRHLTAGYIDDPQSGAWLIDHRPKVAAEAYAIVLFHGIDDVAVDRYRAIQERMGEGIDIPNEYRSILSYLNGAQILKGHFFGIPRSMLTYPPLLDRSIRQPMDISSANKFWKVQYKAEPRFFFGSGPYSHEENLGYFWGGDGRIETFRTGGARVDSYCNFEGFLDGEIARLTSIYPDYEQRQEAFWRELSRNKKLLMWRGLRGR